MGESMMRFFTVTERTVSGRNRYGFGSRRRIRRSFSPGVTARIPLRKPLPDGRRRPGTAAFDRSPGVPQPVPPSLPPFRDPPRNRIPSAPERRSGPAGSGEGGARESACAERRAASAKNGRAAAYAGRDNAPGTPAGFQPDLRNGRNTRSSRFHGNG